MATSVKQIKSALERVEAIESDAMLSPSEIVSLVGNKSIIPSIFTVYRFIKRGDLKAVNLATESEPRYHVKGKDFKRFFTKRYGKL